MPRSPAAVLLLFATMLPAQAKPDLDRARELLGGRQEAEVRDGAEICRRANDVAAVELLLEVLAQTDRRTHLHLAPGHYRDLVWDALCGITDPYARRRVELEVKTGKDTRVRQWCAELLGIYGEADFGDTLRRVLGSKNEDLERWAVRSLGMVGNAEMTKYLLPSTKARSDYVRANALEAMARLDAAHRPAFVAAIAADKSGGVRCALLGALPELAPDQVEALCTTALRDDDWRPRMQAVQNLGHIRTRTAVDSLVVALGDGRPVVAARALRELQELTGQPIEQPQVFAKWWADNRDTFAFPDGRGLAKRDAGGTVSYNGVPVDSDHVAFLLDKSVQMKQRLKSQNATKEDAAHAELERVLTLLDGKITFNVWNYDVELTAFEKKPVKLTAKTMKRAMQFAGAPSNGREKDIWQALDTVVADPTLDTIYLLSSGEPDTGLYVHWNRVTRHLADLDRFQKVTVHTIAYTDNDWYRDQLKKIAEVTGGHCEQIQ